VGPRYVKAHTKLAPFQNLAGQCGEPGISGTAFDSCDRLQPSDAGDVVQRPWTKISILRCLCSCRQARAAQQQRAATSADGYWATGTACTRAS